MLRPVGGRTEHNHMHMPQAERYPVIAFERLVAVPGLSVTASHSASDEAGLEAAAVLATVTDPSVVRDPQAATTHQGDVHQLKTVVGSAARFTLIDSAEAARSARSAGCSRR